MSDWHTRMARALRVAQDAAKEAGTWIRQEQGKLKPEDISLKGPSDFVTRVDKGAEKLILDRIAKECPGDDVLSEEQGGTLGKAEHLWVVDPLDGTNNFVHGISRYCVSIAYAAEGRPEVAAVYDPVRDELFSCKRDEGVWLNGKPIGVSAETDMAKASVAAGLPTRHRDLLPQWLEQFGRVAKACGTTRKTGAAALDLACVAVGRFDGYWEPRLAPWDMAAGALLVEVAGGLTSDDLGKPWTLNASGIIAANPDLHPRLVELVSPAVGSAKN